MSPMEPPAGEEPRPAPFFLRMVAFAMDCIFVIFASLIAVQAFFPDEIASGKLTMESYNEQLQTLEEAMKRGDSSAEASIEGMLKELAQEPSVIAMMNAIIFSFLWVGIAYWFVGERFFAGSSLGKRMFLLSTLSLRDGKTPGTGIALFRAFLKTIPILQQYLAFSYLVALINRRRMAGHDYVCQTMVIRGRAAPKEQEESTNSSH